MENIFSKMKELLGHDEDNNDLFFNREFVLELKNNANEMLYLCKQLDNNPAIIETLNRCFENKTSDPKAYKSANFFLSDLITLNKIFVKQQTEKSQFALAYYYDVLRNGQFADENRTEELNQLLSKKNFKTQLIDISQANSLNTRFKNGMIILPGLKNKFPKEYDIINLFYKKHVRQIFGVELENEQQFLETLGSLDQQSTDSETKNEDSLEIVLAELNELVGLAKVKKDVKELINLLKIQEKRSLEGLKNIDFTLHTVFFGPPGTGKTSVARLLSRIFKHLGFLSQGQLYETDREGLVAGYVGQTASKVDAAVEKSRGGVLFIDEAYSLTQTSLGNDYGAEAVNTLLKRMEDYRSDFAVVVAGYTEPMKEFIESNPGLRSRFNRYFYFDHFTSEELIQIFKSFCTKSDFIITNEAEEKLSDTFRLLLDKKDEGFGNARVVRNLFEKCIQRQANRIIEIKKINKKTLKTITESDVPEPNDTVLEVYISTSKTD